MENSIEKWRDYFSTANRDIFDIIEKAIVVAACDRPYDFKLKRDRIAETLFSCKLTKCLGCDDLVKNPLIESGGSKESKTNGIVTMGNNQIHSYGDVEDLNDEIDEDSQIVEEVLKIKGVLDNSEKQSEALLLESLRGLQLLPLSLETLKVTEIGKTVNALRKHESKQIRELVKTLIWDWKKMVDEWVDAAKAIADAEIEEQYIKKSAIEEEEDLSQFDGVDDYGNHQKSRGFDNKNECGKNPTHDSRALALLEDKKVEPTKSDEALLKKPNRPIHRVFGPDKPKPSLQPKANNDTTRVTIQKKMTSFQNENSKIDNEALDKTRLEAAKRKLHERYQEAENAKKRRTVQVVELCDLPKQSLIQRNNQQTRQRRH